MLHTALSPAAAGVARAVAALGTVKAQAKVRVEAAVNPFDFWPLVEQGHAEWSKLGDAELDGRRIPARETLAMLREGLRHDRFKLFLIFEQGEKAPAGFAVVTLAGGYLQGLMAWVKPELRGRGLWRAYHAEMDKLVKRLSLKGHAFASTLPMFEEIAPRLGFHISSTIEQSQGPAVRHWLKEA